MINEEALKELKQIMAKKIKEDYDLKTGLFCYLMYGSLTHPNYTELPDNQDEKLGETIDLIASNDLRILDEMFEKGMPDDFDLFLMCNGEATELLDEVKVKGDDDMIREMLLTAIAATFRIWFDKITVEDILAFFEEKEHKELPSMVDSSITFAWAIDQCIPCSDLRSFDKIVEKVSDGAGDIPGVYEAMGDMCDMFKKCVPVLEDFGVSEKFINENIKACQNFFMMGFVMYNMIPASRDAKKLLFDDKEYEDFYKRFIDKIAGDELKKEIKSEVHNKIYSMILRMSMMIAWNDDKDGEGRKELYEESTKEVAKKYSKKKR